MKDNANYNKLKGSIEECIRESYRLRSIGTTSNWSDAVIACVRGKINANPNADKNRQNADRDEKHLNKFFEKLENCLDAEIGQINEKNLQRYFIENEDGLSDYLK